MDPHDVVSGDDEQFSLLLARYGEALAAGDDADPAADPALSVALRQRLQCALSCLRRMQLLRMWPEAEDTVTRLMEGTITLHDDMVGKQIGRFHILRTLGRGGGGVVFLAFDPDLRREVALKLPHLTALLAPDLRQRLLREAQAAARLDHPNLIPVHEVGECDGVCFLVSAYCRGGSLADWLKQRTEPVPLRQAAELLAVLADAVQYVHEHGIFHRDIKPGNILLEPSVEHSPRECDPTRGASRPHLPNDELDFTPRLTDFGLAKQLKCDSGQTASGTLLGTPRYMAPEQIECRTGDIGPRTDVYGLGAVLYELLTGQPPFKGTSDAETLERALYEMPLRPRALRPKVPRDLEVICLKCLEKRPERRYASAAELAGDLRRFLAGESIQARPPGSAERLYKWMRRHPRTMVLGSLVGLAALALLGGSIYVRAMKRTHDDHLEAAARKHEEHQETIRQNESSLRQFHYADGIALARRHWDKRRLDELVNQLQRHLPPTGANSVDDPRGFEWRYLSRQAHALRWQRRSPDSSLFCVAFSPDGTTCVTGHHGGAIRLWDRTSGRMREILTGHKQPVCTLAYSPDGKYLVSGYGAPGHMLGEIRLWDAKTLKLLDAFPDLPGEVHTLAFSVDGRSLAAIVGNTVKLWNNFHPADKAAGSPITIPLDGGAASLAFHPKDAILAVGRVDGKISLHAAADGRVLADWRGHASIVLSLAYARNTGLLASGGRDGVVRMWGRDSNRLLAEYRHDDKVCNVAFSPDDRTVASLSFDGVVKLWDVNEKRDRFLLAMPPGWGQCLAFSPDGKDLAVGKQDGNLWMCDLSQAMEATSWLGHRIGPLASEAWAVAFSPDGKTLASAGDDHMVRLWDPASGRPRGVLGDHRSLVSCIAFSPDGKLLATGGFDPLASVKIWNVTTGAEVATLRGHPTPVDALAFAPDGKILATAGRDNVTRLWDIATRKDRPILSGTKIESLAYSPDGRTLVLGGEKANVFLWNVESEQVRQTLVSHPMGHVAVAFSPDGKTLASGDTEGRVRLWDAESGAPRAGIRSHTGPVNCLAFTPDGKTLASASFDRTVKLWQTASGRELLTLAKHGDRVRWLTFSPDGAMLATAGHDGILRIYRADRETLSK